MFAPVTVPSLPDWVALATLGLLIGPYLLAIVAGRPRWVRYVALVHIAIVGALIVANLLRPLPVFGMMQLIFGLMLVIAILILAGLAHFLADKSRIYLWRAESIPVEMKE